MSRQRGSEEITVCPGESGTQCLRKCSWRCFCRHFAKGLDPRLRGKDRSAHFLHSSKRGPVVDSLLRLIEISKIRRSLPFLRRHDHAVGAQKVGLSLDADMIVVLHAVVLDPPRMRIGAAAIALGHSPRMYQSMVEDGNLVADDVRSVLVKGIALLDYGLVVRMQR